MLDTMYTIQQTAAALGVTTRTVHRFIRGENGREKLPAQKIGARWRIKEKDLTEYIDRLRN